LGEAPAPDAEQIDERKTAMAPMPIDSGRRGEREEAGDVDRKSGGKSRDRAQVATVKSIQPHRKPASGPTRVMYE
jgi:hypothetical protein